MPIDLGKYDFRGFPNDFQKGDYNRCAEYVAAHNGACTAVFDLGTRAGRLLVAPRRIPDRIEKKTFFNSGYAFNLGQAVDPDTHELDIESRRFKNVMTYVESHVENLRSIGVVEIYAIGTAVFRWLNAACLERVKGHFRARVGFELDVLSNDQEYLQSIWSIPEVMSRRGEPMKFGDNDVLALLDQGGGSLEIAWMTWNERMKADPHVKEDLFPALGTQAMRRDFFHWDENLDEYEGGPQANRRTVANQIDLLKRNARGQIRAWRTGPSKPVDDAWKIHVFALGTAVTEITSGNGFEKNGKKVSIEKIDAEVEKILTGFDGKRRQVLSLYKALEGLPGAGVEVWRERKRLDKEFAILLGLPVFKEVLQKLGTDSLTVYGYGLRYGFYVWKKLKADITRHADSNFVCASFAPTDIEQARSELQLLERFGVRFWYDDDSIAPQERERVIREMIDRSDGVVPMITQAGATHPKVQRFVDYATRTRKPIVGINLDDSSTPNIADATWIKRPGVSDGRFVEQLKRALPASCIS